jgi:hypothetical protein
MIRTAITPAAYAAIAATLALGTVAVEPELRHGARATLHGQLNEPTQRGYKSEPPKCFRTALSEARGAAFGPPFWFVM